MPFSLHRVLVVEDDPASRRFLEIALEKLGYTVEGTEDAAQAEERLTPDRIGAFSCIVTDFRMPDRSGLELLAWIRERDPSLATILVTAEGEKQLVAESLRGGAADFLDKPVDLRKLQAAVAQAVKKTRKQRQMVESDLSVKEVGRTQQRMLSMDSREASQRVDLCFYPKREAGGDFFSRFRSAPERFSCLLTDVSGHDMQAAYISAYFQGLVRGLLARGAALEETFQGFNQLLLEEWNQAGSLCRQQADLHTSIAACALTIDWAGATVTAITQGTPAPRYLHPAGEARVLGASGGFPLGWFSELSATSATCSIADGGAIGLWTDGLEDLAEKLGVNPLSLAHALRRSEERHEKHPALEAATDDILLAVIHLSAPGIAAEQYWPVISEQYHGGQAGEIDALQSFWRRNLLLAVPELAEGQLHDMLLASREALLNALKHGCGSRADRTACFQVACRQAASTIRVKVSDCGPGYHFDFAGQQGQPSQELADHHRGLMLMRHFASAMNFERNGASVTMQFEGP